MASTDKTTGGTPAAQRPRPVHSALLLLWSAIALYALLLGNDLLGSNSAPSAWVVPLVTVAVVAVLIGFIARGSNVARWIYAVMFVLGSLPLAIDPGSVFARSSLIGSLNVLMFVLQLAALVLLFARGAGGWFRQSAGMPIG